MLKDTYLNISLTLGVQNKVKEIIEKEELLYFDLEFNIKKQINQEKEMREINKKLDILKIYKEAIEKIEFDCTKTKEKISLSKNL
jgi:hypothetical protein